MRVSTATPPSLLGRNAELERIDALLTGAAGGAGGTLLVLGEPGGGKTTLLASARATVPDWTVVACTGVESEAELPFSGLHELLRPLLPGLGGLPGPQRSALEGALGLREVETVPPFGVAAATLALLVGAAADRPVLVVVDDLQWVDRSTVAVLAFVARRIVPDRVAILLAGRPGAELPGFREPPAVLSGLDRDAVAGLVERQAGRVIPDAVLDDLTAASGGNPLAIVEAVEHFGDDLWVGGRAFLAPLPVGELIDRGFADRLAGLPEQTGMALEVVAASLGDDAFAIVAALEGLGFERHALEAAERSDVVVVGDGTIRFSHPLLRALVIRRADPARLRACHQALAGVTGEASGARAWHLAGAATVADEAVAVALEKAADSFAQRGGAVGAARALERAAALSPDPERRAERLVRAAEEARAAGHVPWGMALYDEAVERTASPALALAARFARETLAAHHQPVPDLADRVLAFAREAIGVDLDLAVDALAYVSVEAILVGAPRLTEACSELFESLDIGPDATGFTSGAVDFHFALTALVYGPERGGGDADRPLVERVDAVAALDDHRGMVLAMQALIWLDEHALARRRIDDAVERYRSSGDVLNLAQLLGVRAYGDIRTGDWDLAAAGLAEAIRIGAAHELDFLSIVANAELCILRAGRGDTTLLASVPALERAAHTQEFRIIAEYLGSAKGLLALGLGQAEVAIEELERVRTWKEAAEQLEPVIHPWAADLVDAYLLAGDRGAADAALARLRARSEASRRPWAVASVARLEAALAPDDAYEAAFAHAITLLDAVPARFDRARAQLAFGQRLRRHRRRVDARVQLDSALATFEELGAVPWAEQARRELEASGSALRRDSEADPAALTPQEAQVAELVAGGASNKEVAAALFLSPKTIEAHLGRVYRKRGVSSRTQLAAAMRADLPA